MFLSKAFSWLLLLVTYESFVEIAGAQSPNSEEAIEAIERPVLKSLNLHNDLHIGDNNVMDIIVTGLEGSTSYLTVWLDSNRDRVYQTDEIIVEDYEVNHVGEEKIRISFDISQLVHPGMSSIGLELNEDKEGSGGILDFQKVVIPVYKRKRRQSSNDVRQQRTPHNLYRKSLEEVQLERQEFSPEHDSTYNPTIKHSAQDVHSPQDSNDANDDNTTLWIVTICLIGGLMILVGVGIGLYFHVEKRKKKQADSQARLEAIQLQKDPARDALSEWETF